MSISVGCRSGCGKEDCEIYKNGLEFTSFCRKCKSEWSPDIEIIGKYFNLKYARNYYERFSKPKAPVIYKKDHSKTQSKKKISKQQRREFKKLRREKKHKEVIAKYSKLKKEDFYNSREWKELRFKVLIKYGRKCMCCNTKDKVLHVDHIKPLSKFPHLCLSFNNLQVLCADCNIGKSNISMEDFRPKLTESFNR